MRPQDKTWASSPAETNDYQLGCLWRSQGYKMSSIFFSGWGGGGGLFLGSRNGGVPSGSPNFYTIA